MEAELIDYNDDIAKVKLDIDFITKTKLNMFIEEGYDMSKISGVGSFYKEALDYARNH